MRMQDKTKEKHSRTWDRWAKAWDLMLSLVGYDIAFREEAVERLQLKKGDTVLDLACGTGLNFEYLQRKIGKEGRIIALDYSQEMLQKAKEKAEKNGWDNIRFTKTDVSGFERDKQVDAVLCTWSMVSFQDHEKALENSVKTLKNNGKYVIVDFQLMDGLKGRILNPIYTLPFKATHQHLDIKPWKTMEKYLKNVVKEDFSGWFASYYIASGAKTDLRSICQRPYVYMGKEKQPATRGDL